MQNTEYMQLPQTAGQLFIKVLLGWPPTGSSQTAEICSVALACKRLKGSHTFDILAGALNDIHTEYNICEKIIRTTTDNASNSIKAFRLYGEGDVSDSENAEGLEEETQGVMDEEMVYISSQSITIVHVIFWTWSQQ